MILKCGSYSHAQNEAEIFVEKLPYLSDRGYVAGVTHRWKIKGKLLAASQAALTTAINDLENAYGTGGHDVGLYLDDGSTLTAHYLQNSQAAGGVRTIRIAYPDGAGGEYSFWRSYEIDLEADYQLGNVALRDFSESVTYQGTGGPRRVLIETLDGFVVEQVVAQRTAYRAIQSGQMSLYGSYPTPPAPLWPAAELPDLRQVVPIAPQREGANLTAYGMQWQYTFQSASPLSGMPTIR